MCSESSTQLLLLLINGTCSNPRLCSVFLDTHEALLPRKFELFTADSIIAAIFHACTVRVLPYSG